MRNKKRFCKSKTVIGLTGGIASGKKTAAKILKGLGAYIINADVVYSSLISRGKPLYKKLIRCFGTNILDLRKNISRSKLAKIVFKDKKKLEILNKLTHPEIIHQIQSEIKKSKGKIIVLTAPLLIESGRLDLVDCVWLVYLDKSKQIRRLIKRDNISKKEAELRVKAQFPLKKKIPFADVVIDNSGTIRETALQIIKMWNQMQE